MDELETSLLQYHKKIAISLDKGLTSVREAAVDSVETMGMGADRAINNLSYFFDDYDDVYEKISYEDSRFYRMIKGIYSGINPVKEVINIFFDHLMANLDEEEIDKLNILLKGTFGVLGMLSTTRMTRGYIAAAVSELIYVAVLRSKLARKLINKGGNIAMAFSGGYGIIEKAARAKDRLYISNPILYHTLHLKNVEMAYFLVEPVISTELNMISGNKKTVDQVFESIVRMVYP